MFYQTDVRRTRTRLVDVNRVYDFDRERANVLSDSPGVAPTRSLIQNAHTCTVPGRLSINRKQTRSLAYRTDNVNVFVLPSSISFCPIALSPPVRPPRLVPRGDGALSAHSPRLGSRRHSLRGPPLFSTRPSRPMRRYLLPRRIL